MSQLKTLSNRRRKNNEAGLSLVEVLIALFLFSIGVLATAQTLDLSIQKNSSARLMTEATRAAQAKMEKLRSVAYTDASLIEDSSPYGPVNVDIFDVSWTVKEDTPMPDMKKISILVKWLEQGFAKNYTLDFIRQ